MKYTNTLLMRMTWQNSDFKTRSKWYRKSEYRQKKLNTDIMPETKSMYFWRVESITTIWQLLIQAWSSPNSKRTQPTLLVSLLIGKMKYYSISLILFLVVTTLFRDHYDLYQFYLCILYPWSGKLRGDEMARKKSIGWLWTFASESGDFHKSRNSQMPHSFSKTVKVQQEKEVTQFIS